MPGGRVPGSPLSEAEKKQRDEARAKGTLAKLLQTKCIKGHKYTPANTYWTPTGKRECRTCRYQRQIEKRAKKRREIERVYVESFAVHATVT